MSGGLVALLDDIATLAKVTASSIADVAANAVKASSKAVGVVIDDTAVTQLVSLLWTTISALWCYWKDNDITVRARARKARLAGKHAA